MVGELSYSANPHRRQSMSCLLMPLGGSTEPLAQLFHCRLRIERRGILIRGTEDFWRRKRCESYPQTVWAWAVPPSSMSVQVASPAATMLEMDELREAMR